MSIIVSYPESVTASGNTRSNSQSTQDTYPEVGLDWLDMRGIVNSAALIDIIEWVASACDDVVDWQSGKPFGRHKILGQSVRSVRGGVFAWEVRGDKAELLISLPGKAMAAIGSVRAQGRVLSRLSVLGLTCTRLDLYIDDYGGYLARLRESAFVAYGQGKAHGFKRWVWWESYENFEAKSQRTAYLGSRQSDSFVRIYDKDNRVRWERQTRGEISAAICSDLVSFHDAVGGEVEYDEAAASRLKSHLVGNIQFLEAKGKNLDRAIPCDFWQQFIDWIGQPMVRVKKPSVPRLLEATLRWLDRQVSKSLALVKSACRENWPEYLANLLARGRERFSRQDELIVEKFMGA